MDILFYRDDRINKNNLIIPHPRLHERLFVLEPLKEIAPDFVHPVLKKSVRGLYNELNKSSFVRKSKVSNT